jgi:hypothetical protein
MQKTKDNVMYITKNSQEAYTFSSRVMEVPVALSCVDKSRETVENGEDVAYDDWFDQKSDLVN